MLSSEVARACVRSQPPCVGIGVGGGVGGEGANGARAGEQDAAVHLTVAAAERGLRNDVVASYLAGEQVSRDSGREAALALFHPWCTP